MRHIKSQFRVVLAGKPDNEAYGQQLRRLIEQWGLQERVQLLGWITEEEKARWMNNAYAALDTPCDVDSYGCATLEAFHAGKPVITLTDSGGMAELVEHERSGLVVPPTAVELAEAMETLWADRGRCRALGEAAQARLRQLRIDWDYTLDRLLEV
jgi:glycosyltransferase involved in cell wall biosynthesis